ncbi:MAG: glycoside hydrolase family 31 protein [Scytonema sp. PMC 1069.18]|nr:glycoside hydrolase family 31 protein [Scytonema sp. PMC 1069.18]MEC4882864.1 glycoside hydrolase family 31 protein [Scytonema sp. PMC 1070.18]
MNSLKQIKLGINYLLGSLLYIHHLPKAYLYSQQRDKNDRYYKRPPTKEAFDNPGKLVRSESTARGATFYFENAELEICFLTENLVRVNWKPSISPVPYAIARHEWEEVATKLEPTDGNWTISTPALQVTVKVDGSLVFCDAFGQILRQEKPPQRKDYGWIHKAQLRDEEHIYGLGERTTPLNLRQAKNKKQQPITFRMWNFDPAGSYTPGTEPMYICIPVYLGLHSTGSYLIFYENSFEAKFTFTETATADFEGGALRYYLTTGTPAQCIEQYTELTGRPPLPPRWALGYHQSHWGYLYEQTVRNEAKSFQSHNLPLSAIHLDIDCQVGARAFTIDPARFPNLTSFTQELRDMGVHLVTINNPGIKCSRDNNLYLEGLVLKGCCTYPDGRPVAAPVWPGWSIFPDFTNPKVRSWWGRQYQYLLDVGVAGFWQDMNEPAIFVISGDRSLPKVARHHMEGRGGEHREAHNIYGFLQARTGYESLQQYHPNRRPFIVSRAGWAGLQRYTWIWTGDVSSSWDCLRITVSMVVGLGLSGISYSGSDIGGFHGNPSAELYLRWFQMATFHTFYRSHSAIYVANRTPWYYGEPYLSIVREYLQLRYRLMPYFYTLSWEAKQKGHPPVRPVFWYDSSDSRLWDINDAFFLGNALLVCPIVEKGKRSRQVTLPKGYWYNFWDDAVVEGSQQVTMEAPLEKIPLLVWAGSILPMEENHHLTLHIYPPVEGSSETVLYSDAGDGYGESRLDKFQMMRSENSLEITWREEGDYPFPYNSVRLHLHGVVPSQVWVDGVEVACHNQQLQCDRFEKVRIQA